MSYTVVDHKDNQAAPILVQTHSTYKNQLWVTVLVGETHKL